jgi:hypothetical protein
MEKRAIAYTSDIMLGNSGEIIDRSFQRKRIEQYAKENTVNIVAWFEDEVYDELFARPKINELLAYAEPYDLLLVERTWAISRKWLELRALIKALEPKKVRLEATTTLWDCVSQMARDFYRPAGKRNPLPVCVPNAEEEGRPTSINLVETYGRTAKSVERHIDVVIEANPSSAKIRRPKQVVLAGLR